MPDFPLVSVVILNYNGLKYLDGILKACLDSVLKSNYPNLEVIFVDNGSTDGSAEFVARHYPKVRIVKNRCNLGFSEGFNRGIKASRGKYIALLSNDMTVDSNWLNPIISFMEENPKVGLAGFKRIILGTKDIIDGIGGNLYLSGRVKSIGRLEIDRGQYDTIREDLDYIGGAMVIRRETLNKAGLFDPNFFIFSEDIDLCYRIRKNGYKIVYIPYSIIYHKGQATLQRLDSRGLYLEYMANRSRIRCAIIHFTFIRLLSTFLIDLIWLILGNALTKKALLKAYWWNLKSISETLKKRLLYGPSPPYKCKYPILGFQLSSLKRRIRQIFHLDKVIATLERKAKRRMKCRKLLK